jgi:hypothetical protein
MDRESPITWLSRKEEQSKMTPARLRTPLSGKRSSLIIEMQESLT